MRPEELESGLLIRRGRGEVLTVTRVFKRVFHARQELLDDGEPPPHSTVHTFPMESAVLFDLASGRDRKRVKRAYRGEERA